MNVLLEADQVSPASRTGVYIFGPKLPNGGFAAKDLEVGMQQLEKAGFLPKGTLAKHSAIDVMNSLIRYGYTFVSKVDGKDVEVIGKIPIQVPAEEKDSASQFLGLDQKTTIAYKAHPTDNKRMLNADQVLFGAKIEQEGEPGDPDEDLGTPKATRPPLPLTLGLGKFNWNDGDGLFIENLEPGGSAALAGIQVGDKIVGVESFKDRQGKTRPGYMIHNGNNLYNILKAAAPDQQMTFNVQRGDRYYDFPMKPRVFTPPGEQTPAQPEPEMQPPPRPRAQRRRQAFDRARQTARVEPNEPTPSRETGNVKPNVSALT